MRYSTPEKILMLLENNPYPHDMRVRAEAETLTEAGYQVSVIAPCGLKQPWHETIDDVHVYRYPIIFSFNNFWGYLWEYSYALIATFFISILVFLRDGFDILHAHNPPDIFVFLALLYRPFGVRFIFDHHDLSPELFRLRFGKKGKQFIQQIIIWLENLSCKVADHVITTNQSYMEVEITRAGIPAEKITIVRNGPDLRRVRSLEPDPGLRKKAEIIIVYLGTIGIQDGLDYLLRAIKHLYDDLGRKNFFLVVIGDGDAAEDLKLLSIELGISDYVTFEGRKSGDDLFHYVSTADICVEPAPSNPLNDRSTMIKLMEYMALAKPIVAFDLPEHHVTAQDSALYAIPNDEMAFARALLKLMDNPKLRTEMGCFGEQRIKTTLSWQFSAPHLLEAYRILQGKTVKPSLSPISDIRDSNNTANFKTKNGQIHKVIENK
jgi:glycosyltransferase involved in cell wall biosynthesis